MGSSFMVGATGEQRAELFAAIDSGAARLVPGSSFRDGVENEYRIDFYAVGSELYRTEYNGRTTRTEVHRITDGWEKTAHMKRMS